MARNVVVKRTRASEEAGGLFIDFGGVPQALAKLDPASAKELKKAMKAIAGHVVKVAQGRMEFGPGAAMSSYRAGGGLSGAWVKHAGGPKGGTGELDYVPWLEYGGGQPGVRGVTAVPRRRSGWAGWFLSALGEESGGIRRPVRAKGRYIYPAIGSSRQFIADEGYAAIDRAAHSVQLATKRA